MVIWEATMAQLSCLQAVERARAIEKLLEKYPVLRRYIKVQYLYDLRENAEDELDLDTSHPVDAAVEGKVPFDVAKQLPLSREEAQLLKPYVDFGKFIVSGQYPANKWKRLEEKGDLLLVEWYDYDDITPHYALLRKVTDGPFGELYEEVARVYGEDESFIRRCEELGFTYFKRKKEQRRREEELRKRAIARIEEVKEVLKEVEQYIKFKANYWLQPDCAEVLFNVEVGNGRWLPKQTFDAVVNRLKSLGFKFNKTWKVWVLKEVVRC